MSELDKCPHCGSEGEVASWDYKRQWQVTCISCGAQSGIFNSREQAIAYWNRRADPIRDELVSALGVMLDQCDYTNKACGVMEHVGAVLSLDAIKKARAALAKHEKETK